jgi:anti-sigma factor RsiW
VVEEMACVELVERVTGYLEGVLAPEEVARLRAHLSSCDGCQAHLRQVRAALRVLETTPGERLSPEADDAVVGMFRAWARGTAR